MGREGVAPYTVAEEEKIKGRGLKVLKGVERGEETKEATARVARVFVE
jgi:hypothetical protein